MRPHKKKKEQFMGDFIITTLELHLQGRRQAQTTEKGPKNPAQSSERNKFKIHTYH